ncbi:hypothetical protein GCM10025858_14730 [Alicyclobacillus sacchari]|nr:hypothetical protein GCM10025858_14730 [Alicyclobacillus sacchari]
MFSISRARLHKDKFVEEYAEWAPETVQALKDGGGDVRAAVAAPESCRWQLRTTNGVE